MESVSIDESVRIEHYEAYTTVNEQAQIHGVALIPRISRNQNLYTKGELRRFNNVQVPLNWEHNPNRVIGHATFHYNEDTEQVFYDGMITDDSAASLARNRTLFTSIEAQPVSSRDICNGPDDCFAMPFGLVPKGLALTETPGVPETTVKVIEKYIKECNSDQHLEQKYAPKQANLQNEKHIEDILKDKDNHQIAHLLADNLSQERVKEVLDQFCTDCGELKKTDS